MAPGTHTEGNRVNFSFDVSFPMMNYQADNDDHGYGDDLTNDRFVFETTFKEATETTSYDEEGEDEKDFCYYYHPSSLESSRGIEERDYLSPHSPMLTPSPQQQRRWGDDQNNQGCQPLQRDGEDDQLNCRGVEQKLNSGRSQYLHDDDPLDGRISINHTIRPQRRRVEEEEEEDHEEIRNPRRRHYTNQESEEDTEQYIHRCPFAHCSHHHHNIDSPSSQENPLEDSKRNQRKFAGLSSSVRSNLSDSHDNNFGISRDNSERLSIETRRYGDTSISSRVPYHSCTDTKPMRYGSTPPGGTASNWQTKPNIPVHQKHRLNHNNNICYEDKGGSECSRGSDNTSLRVGPSEHEEKIRRRPRHHRLDPTSMTTKEDLVASTLLLEAINSGAAAACERQDTCPGFDTDAFICGSPPPVHWHHQNDIRSNSNSGGGDGATNGDKRYISHRNNIPQTSEQEEEEADLQGYVRREFIDVLKRSPQVIDNDPAASSEIRLLKRDLENGSSIKQATYNDDNHQNQDDRLHGVDETEQEITYDADDVKNNLWQSTAMKQQVTPGLRRRAIEYIVKQLGGGSIKRTGASTTTSPTTTSSSSAKINNNTTTTINSTITDNTELLDTPLTTATQTSNNIPSPAQSPSHFTTQQTEHHHYNSLPNTRGSTLDSTTTTATTVVGCDFTTQQIEHHHYNLLPNTRASTLDCTTTQQTEDHQYNSLPNTRASILDSTTPTTTTIVGCGFTTQQAEHHHYNSLPNTRAPTLDSTTTATATVVGSPEDVCTTTVGCSMAGSSSSEGDSSPAVRRLYRTVERLEETVYIAANAKKEDYMKTLASKLAIIFDELQQHNSLQIIPQHQPQQPPPSSSSQPSSLPPIITSLPQHLITATPLLPITRHHSLSSKQYTVNDEFIGGLSSQTKSLSEGDVLGPSRNDVGSHMNNNNNNCSKHDQVWVKPHQGRSSSCQI